MTESFRSIKTPWFEGSGTLCFGIPADIVKKLKLNQDSFLLIDLIDDSIIIIKKHEPQFTKIELNKVISHQNDAGEKSITIEEKTKSNDDEFVNPLKDLEL